MAAALLEEFGSADAREREESWRYSKTALRALAQNDFLAADGRALPSSDLLERIDWPHTRGRRVVFINGIHSFAHSDVTAFDGVTIETADDSLALSIAGNEQVVHLVYVSVPDAQPVRWNAQLNIRVAALGARIIEQHIGDMGADVLGSLRVNLEIAERAEAQVTMLTDLPDSVSLYRREQVGVAQDGQHASTHALFGGRLQRHEANIALRGPRSRHAARGVFVVRGRQHIDVHLDVRHAARDTACDVVWRGVADQRARGILHGAITVATGADGADARLQTKNLLLSPHAEIDAQPVLEIYADEVKASHGATVGQLDERALFYLRSRGVPAAVARGLLIAGFCREVLADGSDADLRARLEAALDERLPKLDGVSP
jgi:Fe-S cluster assembly protein SufD